MFAAIAVNVAPIRPLASSVPIGEGVKVTRVCVDTTVSGGRVAAVVAGAVARAVEAPAVFCARFVAVFPAIAVNVAAMRPLASSVPAAVAGARV